MRVLIACEYSGITREAFAARGHDAWSCDLLPSEIPGRHFQADVLKVLDMGWDLLIAHPPCTYLSYAGMRFWQDPERTRKRIAAADFFMRLYQANIPRVCVENPRGIMSKLFRPPDQEIHPWYFGEPEMKRTGLWLRGLPPLRYQLQPDLFSPIAPVQAAPLPVRVEPSGKKRYFTDAIVGNRFKTGHEKSKSFPSIAEAMATQWG